MRLKQNVITALLAAALCVMAPFAVPLGPVPITLATLGVYLAAGLLDPLRSSTAVGLYLMLGGIGIPVFAGFSGGVQHLTGPTGGFLWGFLLCAAVSGLLCRYGHPRLTPLWLTVGTLLLYAMGTVWYAVSCNVSLGGALLVCVVPCLIGDGVKIAVATGLIWSLRERVDRLLSAGMKQREDSL
ncbi:MAG: biotin transporter BioY [Clostridia bacterium]|nr:biotin transporter BioY [Clostridia bacterium]